MTQEEFQVFVRQYVSIWDGKFDEAKLHMWYALLGKFKLAGLTASLMALAMECQYPPKIKEIVNKYEELKKVQEMQWREENSRRLLNVTRSQGDCPICYNEGFYIFRHSDGREYFLRCVCPRGKDLNRYSKEQITNGLRSENPVTKKFEYLYLLDCSDVFTEEDIQIIQIKNTSESEFASMSQDEICRYLSGFAKNI